eukprot:TRINITY_DN11223_c0_g1_i2.p1 TRINITY_DN11223_c0_g1~~TRINITY_DN11223_c0_g1_i2.p1  ORF type:complete len:338 (+),score=67.56 TRINITY_DN11223_c0_g1_i2:61-1074(+)
MSEYKDSRGRGTKRKVENGGGNGKKNRGELNCPPLPPNGYPKEHPFNRDGYRYTLAEPDPHAPHRQEFDENADMAGKPIPPFLCRVVTPESVLLALHDRAHQLTVSDCRLWLTGAKFYCTARATHGVKKGSWYYEMRIADLPEGGALRLGWAQKNANLQAPLGFDKFGYSCRSRKGTRFHDSIGKHYSNGFGQGDVVGCLIDLPEQPGKDYLPITCKDKPLIKFKSHLYYEEKDELQENQKALKPLPGGKITYFLNGKSLGTAFTDIYEGEYFPSVGLYKQVHVKFNFGPRFKAPPGGAVKFRPMSERARELEIEQAMADMRFFSEQTNLKIDDVFL